MEWRVQSNIVFNVTHHSIVFYNFPLSAVPVEALKSYPNEAAFLQNKFNTPLEDNGASGNFT